MSPSNNTIKVRNPVTGEYDYEIAAQSVNEIHALANRAKAAQRNWSALPPRNAAESSAFLPMPSSDTPRR